MHCCNLEKKVWKRKKLLVLYQGVNAVIVEAGNYLTDFLPDLELKIAPVLFNIPFSLSNCWTTSHFKFLPKQITFIKIRYLHA